MYERLSHEVFIAAALGQEMEFRLEGTAYAARRVPPCVITVTRDGHLTLMRGNWTLTVDLGAYPAESSILPEGGGRRLTPEGRADLQATFARLLEAVRKSRGKDFRFDGRGIAAAEGRTLILHGQAAEAVAERPRRFSPEAAGKFKLRPGPGETRDPGRIDRILAKLGEEWRTQPDTRLGQLVETLASRAGWSDGAWLVEDDVIERVLEEEAAKRQPAP